MLENIVLSDIGKCPSRAGNRTFESMCQLIREIEQYRLNRVKNVCIVFTRRVW